MQCIEDSIPYPLVDENFETDVQDMHGGQNKLFNITRRFEKNCKLFNCKEKIIELETNDAKLDNYLQAGEQYYEMFQQILSELVNPIDASCKVRLSIGHDDFNENVNLEFMDKDKLTVQMCFDALDSVVQSRKKRPGYEIQSKNKMTFSIIIAENPKGRGRRCLTELEKSQRNLDKVSKKRNWRTNNHVVTFEDFCKYKNSILEINNSDNYCLIRSILVAKAYADKEKFRQDQITEI